MHLSPRGVSLSLVIGLTLLVAPLYGGEPLQQVGDAVVATTGDGGWAIGNALVRYSVGGEGGRGAASALEDVVGGRNWLMASAPDSFIRVNGQLVNIGSAPSSFVSAEAAEWFGGVRLDLRYRVSSANLEIVRSYACYPGSSVIESWTTFRQEGGQDVTLADLNGFVLSVENGTVNWLAGLSNPDDAGGPFTRSSGDLDEGQVFFLGSERRSAEQAIPWFSIRAGEEEFFGSILWSGSWLLRAERLGDAINVRLGLPAFDTSLAAGASLETPHVIFGITNRRVPDTSSALQAYIEKGIRHGRPLDAYVTYNTWYSKGNFVDEFSILAEMDRAASIGVELFVLDAGWWTDVNLNDSGDFVRRWGNWEVDPDRFPNGLGALSDHAHALGMRFGVWVEPERVDRATVGLPGLAKERFLATRNGLYDPDVPSSGAENPVPGRRRAQPRNPAPPTLSNSKGISAQVCLVDREARAWVYERLVKFIEEARPDYLKWDNNFWVNCTREGHGHGAEDGNFLHHRALQLLIDQLRDAYPSLDIENSASGGNRISLDMLARTEAGWLDDKTDPSARVRHAAEGLFSFLPPSYLLSFSTTAVEGIDDWHTGEVPYVTRSRMLGVPGMSWDLEDMDENARASLEPEIALYKRLRPIQQRAVPLLLSSQVPGQGASAWDAVEFLVPGGGEAALLAYNAFDAPPLAVVRLKGLRPDASYEVESADSGVLGTATGRDLMELGVELQHSDNALGHVLFLHVTE